MEKSGDDPAAQILSVPRSSAVKKKKKGCVSGDDRSLSCPVAFYLPTAMHSGCFLLIRWRLVDVSRFMIRSLIVVDAFSVPLSPRARIHRFLTGLATGWILYGDSGNTRKLGSLRRIDSTVLLVGAGNSPFLSSTVRYRRDVRVAVERLLSLLSDFSIDELTRLFGYFYTSTLVLSFSRLLFDRFGECIPVCITRSS